LRMQKGKLSGKLRQFIAPMRKARLIDKPWKFIVLIILEVVVFGLAYWLLAVHFFPANEAIRNAIVILYIFAVGITIILYGNVTRNRYLNILGFAIFLFAVFVVIDRYEEFAVKISAFAALLVAFAAFAAIDENRRNRQDSIERESRDRKERLIDEVDKWLRELDGRIFPMPAGTLLSKISVIEDRMRRNPKIPFEKWLQVDDVDRRSVEVLGATEGIEEAVYYQKLTSQLNEELSSSIEVIVSNLEERLELFLAREKYPLDYSDKDKLSELNRALTENADRPLEGLGLSDEVAIRVRIERNAGAVRKSILNAVDKTIEIKTSFIQVS